MTDLMHITPLIDLPELPATQQMLDPYREADSWGAVSENRGFFRERSGRSDLYIQGKRIMHNVPLFDAEDALRSIREAIAAALIKRDYQWKRHRANEVAAWDGKFLEARP